MTRFVLVTLTCGVLASCGVRSCGNEAGGASGGAMAPPSTATTETSASAPSTSSSAPSGSAATAPERSEDAKTIVFLGDSLTAGYGLSAKEAFPARIQEKIASSGLRDAWRVVNAGVSGDTTRGGLERLGWVFRAKPTIVFLCLGANDGLRGIDLEETEKNLRAIITRSREAGAKVLLAGMRLPTNYGPDYGRRFADLYPRLAKEYDLPLFPFLIDSVALEARYTLEDGIHPNAAGAVKVAENVWGFLEPYLSR